MVYADVGISMVYADVGIEAPYRMVAARKALHGSFVLNPRGEFTRLRVNYGKVNSRVLHAVTRLR